MTETMADDRRLTSWQQSIVESDGQPVHLYTAQQDFSQDVFFAVDSDTVQHDKCLCYVHLYEKLATLLFA